jgi:ParB family chromosome partitioning protein
MNGFNIGSMMSQENQIKQIPCGMLIPYYNHKFSLYEGERKSDMINSIKKNGVMQPIVCRPHPTEVGKYEILIGHNRWACCKELGLSTVPALIKENLSDKEADEYVNISNLLQRGFSELKISEQAQVVSSSYFELFSQGKRNDIQNELAILSGEATTAPEPTTSREKVGEEYGLSRNTVARLVRIDKLNDKLKVWVDAKLISIRASVELSYLKPSEQDMLYNFNLADDGSMKYKISEAQAKDLRILSADADSLNDELTKTMISRVLIKEKKKPNKKISVKPDTYTKYFKNKDNDEIQEIVEIALQEYFKY